MLEPVPEDDVGELLFVKVLSEGSASEEVEVGLDESVDEVNMVFIWEAAEYRQLFVGGEDSSTLIVHRDE